MNVTGGCHCGAIRFAAEVPPPPVPALDCNCSVCRMTGFLGRMGLYELLTITEGFKEKVAQEPGLTPLKRQGMADGMRPLRLAGALRVAEGLTTIEEVLSATPPLD